MSIVREQYLNFCHFYPIYRQYFGLLLSQCCQFNIDSFKIVCYT